MITRKEYIKALTIVEDYHRQLNEAIAKVRDYRGIPVADFVRDVKISARLWSALNFFMESRPDRPICLEEINEFEFRKLRNTGRVSWKEFVEKREQYMHYRPYLGTQNG